MQRSHLLPLLTAIIVIYFDMTIAQNQAIYPSRLPQQTTTLNLAPIASFVRQLQTSVNYYSGLLYQLDGTIADQTVLTAINRNLTLIKNNVRSLEGFMTNLASGRVSASNIQSSLKPLSDSRSAIGNPPAAFSLVNSGRLQTRQARSWLQTCSDYLQIALKNLSS
uniref:DUF148 domain-containing protein n=1 Tax=Panagrellus redivivus TaxID=6233 RepID=A0A7E4UN64_PANRE